ncbi:putative ester cyclase [Mesorhizobium robiniae]|uniref:Ester cyclase n=1 Tax=Mesorhizobium robiniae TaxID=559315 RepID=A0ABV2GTD7_9HYPH
MDFREVARNFYATIDAQDWDKLAGLVSPDLVVHLGSASPIGYDDWRKSLGEFFVGFPDGHHVIEDYLSDADKVTRCRFEGTHRYLPRRRTERKPSLGWRDPYRSS